MARMLYLECASGISGDMAVAALLDLGSPEESAARERAVLDVLNGLDVGGFEVRVSRVTKSGLDACDFDVVLDDDHENHDHDMTYLYGHLHGGGSSDHHHRNHRHHGHHGHGHHHDDHRPHDHDHDHEHRRNGHHDLGDRHAHESDHGHRGLSDVCAVIDASSATDNAKRIAREIFEIVAHAEAKAHGKPVNEVHFHEVGAIDSIADIIAFAVCLDDLGVNEVVVSDLAEGRGTVRCQHGILPVPVPAVVNIACAHGLTLRMLDIQGELITPTGAAIAAAVRTRPRLPESFTIKAVGLGAGKRIYDTPGILRAMIIEETQGD